MLRRIWTNLRADRKRPPLAELDALEDPERFLWAILPHAARTFSLCIVFLPTRLARPLAIAYLYCRVLDTYEDVLPDVQSKANALRRFADRLLPDGGVVGEAPHVDPELVREERERVYLLLVRRIERIDRLYGELPMEHRAAVRRLVGRMAEGMGWSSAVFAAQSGTLREPVQLSTYCWHVLGTTLLFAEEMVRLEAGLPPAPDEQRVLACARAGECVQLANITRDVERDRARSLYYHPDLAHDDSSIRQRAHRELMLRALRAGDAGLVEFLRGMAFSPGRSLARGGGYLLVSTTQQFYQRLSTRLGVEAWSAEEQTGAIRRIREFLRCAWSAKAAGSVFDRIQREFSSAVRRTAALAPDPAAAPFAHDLADLDLRALTAERDTAHPAASGDSPEEDAASAAGAGH